jgi:hypothetical protein
MTTGVKRIKPLQKGSQKILYTRNTTTLEIPPEQQQRKNPLSFLKIQNKTKNKNLNLI